MTEPLDPLRDLARASLDFLRRFGLEPTREKLPDLIGVFREETSELIEAAQIGTDLDHIGEEAADTLVTLLNLCLACGVDVERLIDQMRYVAAKNDAKTHATHHYHEGKIRRRT